VCQSRELLCLSVRQIKLEETLREDGGALTPPVAAQPRKARAPALC